MMQAQALQDVASLECSALAWHAAHLPTRELWCTCGPGSRSNSRAICPTV